MLPSQPSEGIKSIYTLLLTSLQNSEKTNLYCSRHAVCSTLVQQPQKTNTHTQQFFPIYITQEQESEHWVSWAKEALIHHYCLCLFLPMTGLSSSDRSETLCLAKLKMFTFLTFQKILKIGVCANSVF